MSTEYGPVFPIIPSYTTAGSLDLDRTSAYASYLHAKGATTVMTTSGTSQFNLLSAQEVLDLNTSIANVFPGRLILGLPLLSEPLLFPFLEEITSRYQRAAILLSYPERLYQMSDLVDFFDRVSRAFPLAQLYLHGLPLRSGCKAGTQDFTGQMISSIADAVPRFVGMKEECSTYEAGFKLCASISTKRNFELIVAGGSMRRFLLLQSAGAQSFLTGVGSLFPEVELSFYAHVMNGRLREAASIIAHVETPFFDVFMDVGWHKALRYAAKRLALVGGAERLPMTNLEKNAAHRVDAALDLAREKIEMLRQDHVL